MFCTISLASARECLGSETHDDLQVTSRNDFEKQQWLSLPRLPSNARYVQHKNVCFDWGTFGWALFNLNLDISKYKYYIFMNTSVRGPYLPTYWEVSAARQLTLAIVATNACICGQTGLCQCVMSHEQTPYLPLYAVCFVELMFTKCHKLYDHLSRAWVVSSKQHNQAYRTAVLVMQRSRHWSQLFISRITHQVCRRLLFNIVLQYSQHFSETKQ